jgi:uncharacterized protein with FMN-binding domain
MRKVTLVTLVALALVVPNAEAWAASRAAKAGTKKVVSVRKSFTGTPGSADRWGEVEVTIVVKKTTTTVGTKKTVTRKIVGIRVPVYPDHTGRSMEISSQALPWLAQEVYKAQSANIDMISGATYTSQGFIASLQDALTKSHAW